MVRLAWFSPPPGRDPAGCACADVLLPAVAQAVEVAPFWPGGGSVQGIQLGDPDGFDPEAFDAACFHLGDDPVFLPAYRVAVRHPGICVFHDRSVHRLLLDWGDRGAYERALREDVGPEGARLAGLRDQGIGSDLEPGAIPLAGHVVRGASAVVAESSWALDRLREEGPGVPGIVLPPAAPSIDRGTSGRSGGFVVAAVDSPAAVDRTAIVEAFGRLRDAVPDAELIEPANDGAGPAGMLERADAALSLRRPGHWGWPPALSRALAMGLPVVLEDLSGLEEVPEGAVLRVPPDGGRAGAAGEHLVRLAKDPALQAEIALRARTYAERALDPEMARDKFLELVERPPRPVVEIPRPKPGPAPWPEARRALEDARGRIERLRAEALSPQGLPLFIDLAYRVVLGRPGDEEGIRRQHLALGSGRRTRAEMIRELVGSREFDEAAKLEWLVKEAASTGEFPLREEPAWPDTTERVIEMPWVLSRYRGERTILDVGYAHALDVYLAGLLSLPAEAVHGIDLVEAPIPSVRRVRGDIRRTPYTDGAFDLVLCVSTLEHIGRDNTRYGIRQEYRPGGDADTLREISRILAPDGRLLVTVPFGRRGDHGWFVQYDLEAWKELLAATPLRVEEQDIFRLTRSGWARVVDVRSTETISYGEGTPAAGAVLCASLVR